MSERWVGIDFGTTNTAVGLAATDGSVRLLPLPGPGGRPATHWRSVLYFEPHSRPRARGDAAPSGREEGSELLAGAPAIERYLETQGEGRLVQSVKSHLASESFSKTTIFGRRWSLEEMIAAYLRAVRRAAGVDLGARCVVGRPVRYWGAEAPEDDERAVERMRRALALAGFDDVLFEYEPVGAAARYAARLDHDELLVVADFGGGTTDFSVVRVGPGVAPGDPSAVLASGGLGVSGDAFDARMIDAVVAPALGRGTGYRDEFGAESRIPDWIYTRLRRWHHLSFLKAADTARLLERIAQGALAPALVERLVRLVEDDLGLPLHRAVERTKVELSGARSARLTVGDGVDIDAPIARLAFETWIAEDLEQIDGVLARVLDEAGVAPGDVDRVFATGGTSLVPAVRARLERRFGADKVVGGEELTSVAWGLAARARERFA